MLFKVVLRCRLKKHDNKDNNPLISCLKIVVQGCCLKEARQQKTTILFIPSPKMLSKVVLRCRKKSTLRQRESPQCGIKKIM